MTILSNHLLKWVMWTIPTDTTSNNNNLKKNTYKCQLLQQPLLQGGDGPITEKWKGEIATLNRIARSLDFFMSWA